ncbi:hypothetical protein K432DRAFT_378608 [Lepidopterella palustris CBS 459.81]|uniref:Ribosome assembly protein 3 n=1 Tax=Lepidopterella palustris CBS 459.81 TaxID=1314670 RepID=A0A8E2JIY3_9PEZI|nr:hypothetical protein K432DRAFT_378608 [Lepidopterella palustris CBS 459.81]
MALKPNTVDTPSKPKRTRKRKARTEVSSSSESDSSSSASEAEQKTVIKRERKSKVKVEKRTKEGKLQVDVKRGRREERSQSPDAFEAEEAKEEAKEGTMEVEGEPVVEEKEQARQPDEDFTSFYLRKVTLELADDLDKVRQSGDFNDRSLPMLVHALKQGESIFSREEKARVLGGMKVNAGDMER